MVTWKRRKKRTVGRWTQNIEYIFTQKELDRLVKEKVLQKVMING